MQNLQNNKNDFSSPYRLLKIMTTIFGIVFAAMFCYVGFVEHNALFMIVAMLTFTIFIAIAEYFQRKDNNKNL